MDLFADKIKKVPFTDYFPEYEGDPYVCAILNIKI